jgi:hypothetical protein
VNVSVRIEAVEGAPGDVVFRWDPDTDILTANLKRKPKGEGASGSVEIEGRDGSWLVLDLVAGSVHGVEVAVWPEVKRRSALAPPDAITDGRILVGSGNGSGIASIETTTALQAEADPAERVFHFRLGAPRPTRTIRIANGILIDVDADDHLAGVWLVGVPPLPADEP